MYLHSQVVVVWLIQLVTKVTVILLIAVAKVCQDFE